MEEKRAGRGRAAAPFSLSLSSLFVVVFSLPLEREGVCVCACVFRRGVRAPSRVGGNQMRIRNVLFFGKRGGKWGAAGARCPHESGGKKRGRRWSKGATAPNFFPHSPSRRARIGRGGSDPGVCSEKGSGKRDRSGERTQKNTKKSNHKSLLARAEGISCGLILTSGGGVDGRRAAHGQRRQLGLAQVLVVGEQVVDDGVDVGAADGAQQLKVGRRLLLFFLCWFFGGSRSGVRSVSGRGKEKRRETSPSQKDNKRPLPPPKPQK